MSDHIKRAIVGAAVLVLGTAVGCSSSDAGGAGVSSSTQPDVARSDDQTTESRGPSTDAAAFCGEGTRMLNVDCEKAFNDSCLIGEWSSGSSDPDDTRTWTFSIDGTYTRFSGDEELLTGTWVTWESPREFSGPVTVLGLLTDGQFSGSNYRCLEEGYLDIGGQSVSPPGERFDLGTYHRQ